MKKIAFVCAVPNYDLFNRKSAIDSILCSLLSQLNSDFDITINGKSFSKLESEANSTSEKVVDKLSTTTIGKQFVPRRIKEAIKDKKLKQHNVHLLEELKKKDKPDVVFELLKYGSDVGMELARHFNVPYCIYYDSPITTQFEEVYGYTASKWIAQNERSSLKHAHAVIVYSNPVRDYILSITRRTDSDSFYKFQTLDYSRLTFDKKTGESETPVIGFIGTFMKWHRVDMLVNVFNQLRSNGLQAKLLLVGAGEEYDHIKSLIANSPYNNDITASGFVDGANLIEYKRQIDIGVMPSSNWYGIPTKVFEYGAANIASVAPNTKTISDIFSNEEDCLLFNNNSNAGLLQCLTRLVENENLRLYLADNLNKRIAAEYTAQVARQFYTSLFNGLT